MDLYNRYLMRASGEQKHQARTPAECAVFALLDKGKDDNRFLPRGWEAMSENDRNRWMEETASCIECAIAH